MHRTRRSIAALLLALLIGLGGIAPAYADPAATADAADAANIYRIVALGDSISAGYEPGLEQGDIPYGYVERLYEQALFRGRAEASNFGIIGLRVEGLKRLLQAAKEQTPITAAQLQDFSMYPRTDEIVAFAQSVADRTDELAASLAAADLVTVVIGGNDFRPMFYDVMAQSPAEIAVTLDEQYPLLLAEYVREYEKALRTIAEMAPHAQIIISDQYLPLPKVALNVAGKEANLYDTLYEKVVEPLTDAIDELAAKLQADGLRIASVHVAERFKGAEGRMTYVVSEKDNHPTQDGYEAIAKAFAGAVWPTYRSPAPREADVPISVVILGRELESDYKPTLVNNRTFLALRDVADAMGAELEWIADTQTAVFRQNGREVAITIGAPDIIVDGQPVPLDAPAYLRSVTVSGQVEGKTYVPLAAISVGLGYDVQYSKPLQTAFINK